jgi:hypothetical protein
VPLGSGGTSISDVIIAVVGTPPLLIPPIRIGGDDIIDLLFVSLPLVEVVFLSSLPVLVL